jgi:hypothetical protein
MDGCEHNRLLRVRLPQDNPRELQMELKLNADDTFLLTCGTLGEQTRGTWTVHEP